MVPQPVTQQSVPSLTMLSVAAKQVGRMCLVKVTGEASFRREMSFSKVLRL